MFYERFLQLCASSNISPSTAATSAGFNKGTVSVWKKKFEAGIDVVPEQEVINKICYFFKCSEQWIRGIEQEKAPTPAGERTITFDDFTYAMQNEAKELTDMDKQILLSMAKQLNDARKKKDGESG